MSVETTEPAIAYLAEGKIRIKIGSAQARTVESAYGDSIREKAVRAQQKHSWKAAGDSSPFGATLWGKAALSQDVPLSVTSICAGRDKGGLLYSLESGSLCALLQAEQLGAEERRLWNDNRTRLRHLAISRTTGDLVCAVLHENGTANIGLKAAGESGVKELTEGDSFDTAPRWVPGDGQKILFQSAGVGRNREGQFLTLGPFCIQEMEVASGGMKTLVEDPRYDYLAPQGWADGSLFYIRRPYTAGDRFNFFRTLKDFFLFPFRLLNAIYHFLNFFSSIFTGRQLSTDGGAKARRMNLRQMMIWGNLIEAQKNKRPADEGVDLVPSSWQLCLRDASGETKTLASAVLAYDVNTDGTIVYTNGSALFLLRPDGRKERVLNESMIEQVFFVP
jgi:hypothetical protein